MTFFVKKSLLLLVTILLLICSSHANDHDISHTRYRQEDRKLISAGPLVRMVKGSVTSVAGAKGVGELSKVAAKKIGERHTSKMLENGFKVVYEGGNWYYTFKEQCESPNMNSCNPSPVCFSCGITSTLNNCYRERCVRGEVRCTYYNGGFYVLGTNSNTALSIQDVAKLCSRKH